MLKKFSPGLDGLNMHWLVTGGCGFIGSRLLYFLLKNERNRIRVLDNLSVGSVNAIANLTNSDIACGSIIDWANRLQLVVGDVCSETEVKNVVDGADIIVHLAANTGVQPSVENPHQDLMTNVIGTFNLLESARAANLQKFIFASSGAPLGEATPPIHEALAARPKSPYGSSKLACEGYCSSYFHTFGLNTVSLRFSNVYGPNSGHKTSVVAKYIRASLLKERFQIFGDGEQTRDFLFVDDLIDAIILASGATDIGGEVFQVATQKETTIVRLISLIAEELMCQGIVPAPIQNEATRASDVSRNYASNRKIRSVLNWKPKTSLRDGLKITVQGLIDDLS